jgi:hypothetical protein
MPPVLEVKLHFTYTNFNFIGGVWEASETADLGGFVRHRPPSSAHYPPCTDNIVSRWFHLCFWGGPTKPEWEADECSRRDLVKVTKVRNPRVGARLCSLLYFEPGLSKKESNASYHKTENRRRKSHASEACNKTYITRPMLQLDIK